MSGESISLIRFNGFNRFRIEVLFDCAAFRRCEVIWRENPHCVLPLRAEVPVFRAVSSCAFAPPGGAAGRWATVDRWRVTGGGATGSRRKATGDGAHGRGLACGRRRRMERAGLASPCDRFAGARAVPAASCCYARAAASATSSSRTRSSTVVQSRYRGCR